MVEIKICTVVTTYDTASKRRPLMLCILSLEWFCQNAIADVSSDICVTETQMDKITESHDLFVIHFSRTQKATISSTF